MHRTYNFTIVLKAGFIACLLLFKFSKGLPTESIDKVSKNPVWLSLLHYRDGQSEIDDLSFFIASDGKYNPKSELLETVKAFEESLETDDKHPICKYPARYYFLKKHFQINLKRFPECKELKYFLSEVKPHSVSLIFSDAYINSPASMYGHTFLRIDPEFKSSLLGYAVNYAADADASEGFMYYIKGIFGLYKGYFSTFPYYKKIYEYNNLESRDLWEYKLKLSSEDAYFITLHLWELKDRYVYYYFFNGNCSYHILYLLQLTDEELNLVDKFDFWTIPIDTVRLLKNLGLIDTFHHRPSGSTRIKSFLRSYEINEEEVRLARRIAYFEQDPEDILKLNIDKEEKAKLLELSKLIFIYYSVKDRMPYDEYRKKFLRLLKVRSKVPVVLKYSSSSKTPPDEGHDSQMVSLKFGSDSGKKFYSFVYRSAYHSLYDSDEGYIFGSEILFPYFEIRNYPDMNKFLLEEFSFIRIRSFPVRDIIFKPVSWILGFDYSRDFLKEGKEGFLNFETGLGLTYGYEGKYLLFSGIKNIFQLGVNKINSSRVKFGYESLLLFKLDKSKFVFSFYPYFLLEKRGSFGLKVDVKHNFPLSKNSAVLVGIGFERIFYKNKYNLNFSLNRFF